jgi:protein-tyrosine phosphatase
VTPRRVPIVVIDLHSHVLPGIDDGPETIEGALALARAAVAAGTRTIVATPHVSWRYPNTAEVILPLAQQLRERLAAEGLDLELRSGAEIAMTRIGEVPPEELPRLSLGGGPWLLIEPPFAPVASGIEKTLKELQRRGHRILLAHPERCPTFHRDPRLLESLVAAGVLTSLTAGSLVGAFGETVRRFALALVQQELVHNVASDTHDDLHRSPGISAEIERAGLEPLAEWLTDAVPAAILAGAETIPPRPQVELQEATGRRWWRRER